MAIRDENVEVVRDARQSLCRKFGGLRGWFRHLQQRDRRRKVPAGASAAKEELGRKIVLRGTSGSSITVGTDSELATMIVWGLLGMVAAGFGLWRRHR